MEKAFWEDRWNEEKIGFHQSEINPYLEKYWCSKVTQKSGTVLVPMCGKSKDMLALAHWGFHVVGIDIVAKALDDFIEENNLEGTWSEVKDFKVFKNKEYTLYCGSFFDLPPLNIDYVYDRASLIALPEDLRKQYSRIIQSFGEIHGLVITLEYAAESGPPFSVYEEEIKNIYGGSCRNILTQELNKDDLNFDGVEKVYLF